MSYTVRLTFETNRKLNLKNPYIFQLDGWTVQLNDISDKFRLLHRYEMKAFSFSSEDEATQYGTRLKTALILSTSVNAMPIDWGFDKSRGGLAPRTLQSAKEASGITAINDVHGLSIYPSENQVVRMSGTASTSRREPQSFTTSLATYFADLEMDDGLLMALELYHDAGLQQSAIAKLILSLSVIEQLSNTKIERAKNEVLFLEECIDLLKKSELPQQTKTSLESDLKRQQIISKKRAGRNFVKKYCPEDEKKFCELYDYRGRVAHPTCRESRSGIGGKAGQAFHMVGKILKFLISRKHQCKTASHATSA